MVRIPGSHPGGPGSIPGIGIILYNFFRLFIHKLHFVHFNDNNYLSSGSNEEQRDMSECSKKFAQKYVS